MIKNKLITLILTVAICSSLIFSLCSFVTTTQPATYIYEGLGYTVDVGYVYHRQTATIDKLYHGFIPSFNRIYGHSPETYACDYIMTGTKSLDYTDVVFTASTGFSDVTLATDDNQVSYLNGLVHINGLFRYDDLSNLQIAFEYTDDNMVDFTDVIMSCNIRGYFYDFTTFDVYEVGGTHLVDLAGDFSITGSPNYLDVRKLIDRYVYLYQALEGVDINDYDAFLIQSIEFDIDYTSLYPSFNYIQVKDILYNNDVRASHNGDLQSFIHQFGNDKGYDLGFDNGKEQGLSEGYDEGFNIGYDTGLSDAPAVWGSIGVFLENTIGSFLNFEFVPNISIGGVLSLFACAALFIAFLKLFAGG